METAVATHDKAGDDRTPISQKAASAHIVCEQ
jgi:hypothetical protein